MRHIERPPVDYRLCNGTVTIYHQTGDGSAFDCTRLIFTGAYWEESLIGTVNKQFGTVKRDGLVVLPSGWGERPRWTAPEDYTAQPGTFTVAPGDKLVLGIGPEIETREEWAKLIPAKYGSRLLVAAGIAVFDWNGVPTHVEVTR